MHDLEHLLRSQGNLLSIIFKGPYIQVTDIQIHLDLLTIYIHNWNFITIHLRIEITFLRLHQVMKTLA